MNLLMDLVIAGVPLLAVAAPKAVARARARASWRRKVMEAYSRERLSRYADSIDAHLETRLGRALVRHRLAL
jgi:hypothetical protein